LLSDQVRVHAVDVRPASQRRWDPDRIQPDWIA
jgi:hypothetical protein